MSALRILVAHNRYQQQGGEDGVVEAEIALLRKHGHSVELYSRHNDELHTMPPLRAAYHAAWSPRTATDLAEVVSSFKPDVLHTHNTFPLISPSIYWAATNLGLPVVQTLHNFRLMCLNAMFLREGTPCEDCMGSLPWRGVVHACYRQSRGASAAVAGTIMLHRALGTFRTKITRYIALNEFCRTKFVQAGLPADRIAVKPNFVDFSMPADAARSGFLFVGRLSQEKGITTLARAAVLMSGTQIRVAGEGDGASLLSEMQTIVQLGSLSGDAVRREMSRAIALIVPSLCYENFPRVVVEAFASKLPVIASRLGSFTELVRDGETGLLFEPRDPRDLAEKMAWALAHPEEMTEMGRRARTQYEAEFSADVNYQRLMEIYGEALIEQR